MDMFEDLDHRHQLSLGKSGSREDATYQMPSSRKKLRVPPEYTTMHYDPLPKKRGTIRILVLFPSAHNPDVECELLTPIENSQRSYEALSWCWGSEDKTKYINIRKEGKLYAKYVPPNLFSALRTLRHQHRNRYLWVDAVCIDQDKLDEKNHQVEMMDDIYGKAKSVCIWLGDSTESSQIALPFIKDEVLKLQGFDELCSSQEATWKWRALLELMQRPWFSRRWVVQEIALARKATIYCGTDKIPWEQFAIAVELFVEVETATHRLSEVMKKDPKFYHVPGWFEHVSALGASLLVDATGRLFRDRKEERLMNSGRVEEASEAHPVYDSASSLDSGSDFPFSESPDYTEAKLLSRLSSSSKRKDKRHPLLTLEYLVSSLSIFDTTVPHDTIYALLAIAKDTTPIAAGPDDNQRSDQAQDILEIFTQRKRYSVDYKLPYVDICRVFIQFCIERSHQADRSRALDVLCRPWATEEAVLAARRNTVDKEKQRKERREQVQQSFIKTRQSADRETRGPPNYKINNARGGEPKSGPSEEDAKPENQDMPLPSWVPQLSEAPYAMYLHAGVTGVSMSRKNADPLVGLPTTYSTYMAAETKSVDMKTLRFRKRIDIGHYSMYVRGFELDTIINVQAVARNGQIPQEWSELGGWPGARGDPPSEFWRTLVAGRGRDQKNPPVYFSRACKESFLKGGYMGGAVNTTDLINYEQNSVVAQFCRRVQAVTWNRALVKTETGRLGLVGKNVKVDDRVCILYGCSVPVILRRSGRKSEEIFNNEIEWELQFLVTTLKKNFKRYLERVRKHKERKDKQKLEFFKWESQKCKQWLKDKAWRRNWLDRLQEERETEQKETQVTKRGYDLLKVNVLVPHKELWRDALKQKWANINLRLGREFNAWKTEKEQVWKIEREEAWKNEKEEIWKRHKQDMWEGEKKRRKDEWKKKDEALKMLEEDEWKKKMEDEWNKQNKREAEVWEKEERKWRKEREEIWRKEKRRNKETWAKKNDALKMKREEEWRKEVEEAWGKEKADRLKKEKEELTGADDQSSWKPRVVDWREFELKLKYGRKWKQWFRKRNEALRKEIQAEIQRRREVEDKILEEKTRQSRSNKSARSALEPFSPANAGYFLAGDTTAVEAANNVTADSAVVNGKKRKLSSGERSPKRRRVEEPVRNSTMKQPSAKIELSAEEKKSYNFQIRENFKERLGDDGYYSFLFLGESYIHGMMDGEAMGYQNENGIQSNVFELR